MFKKLLSNLPFNPSLINQVSFYSKRMRAENSIRRMGFGFMALSLLVQGFAVAAPSQPTYANDNNDIFRGGFRDQAHMVNSCNDNVQNFKKILEYYDVTCQDLFFGTVRRIKYNENDGKMYSMGRIPYGFAGEKKVVIPGVGTFYVRPMTAWGSTCFNDGAGCQAVVTKRPDGTPFWVLLACGNPVSYGIPNPPPDEPEPEPEPEPKPERYVGCNALMMNVANGSTVSADSIIRVRGRASGKNLGPNAKVDMYYEYVNARNGTVLDRAESKNVVYDGNLATDPSTKAFTVRDAGRYIFRLAVKYDNSTKNAVGNNRGSCAKEVYVEVGKPCEEAETTEDLLSCIELSKDASNETQGLENANGTIAKPDDVVIYNLHAKNISQDTPIPDYVFEENMSDVLQYATIVDLFGGTIDDANIVRWPAVTIQPGETLTKQIKIKIKNPIPQTTSSENNPGSFDLVLTNVYGDTVNIEVEGELPKRVEVATKELPNTGPGETLAAAFAITVVAGYFFARSRLMSKELEIVKSDYAAGGTQ